MNTIRPLGPMQKRRRVTTLQKRENVNTTRPLGSISPEKISEQLRDLERTGVGLASTLDRVAELADIIQYAPRCGRLSRLMATGCAGPIHPST